MKEGLIIISERERQVLELISLEFSSKEIANILYISIHTVLSHRKSLMKKMNVKNAAGLVRLGFEYGLLVKEDKVRCQMS